MSVWGGPKSSQIQFLLRDGWIRTLEKHIALLFFSEIPQGKDVDGEQECWLMRHFPTFWVQKERRNIRSWGNGYL